MLMTQEAIMNSMKNGFGVVMSGFESIKQKASEAAARTDVSQNLEYSK